MFAIVICGGCPGTSVQGGGKCPEFQGLSRDGTQREIDSSWFYSGDPAADVTTCRRFANIRRPPHGAPCRRLASSVCSYQNIRNDGVSCRRDLSITRAIFFYSNAFDRAIG